MAKNVDIKNEKYQNAIRLKYSDFTYSEIAQLLKVSHVTVKRWFRSNGLLKDEYERYEKERNKVRDKDTDTVLMRHAEVASKMLVSLMGAKSDAMKFRAAKTILDYCFGKAGVNNEPEYEGDGTGQYLELEKILEKIRRKSKDV